MREFRSQGRSQKKIMTEAMSRYSEVFRVLNKKMTDEMKKIIEASASVCLILAMALAVTASQRALE